MANKKSNIFNMNGRLFFFREFLKHPLEIGSVIPSSRFLERRIVEASGVASARVIIELGPGIGGVTRAILRRMSQQSRLLSIEINPNFHGLVSKIEDDRLIAHLGSAGELRDIIAQYELDPPDVIISGIPFSTMSRDTGLQIVETVAAVLPPKGRFVAYQVRDQVAELCQPFLGAWRSSIELRNIPPMRIFQWEKSA